MDLKDLPPSRPKRFTRKCTVAITEETFQKILLIRASGKDVAAFLRGAIERAVAEVKKAG